MSQKLFLVPLAAVSNLVLLYITVQFAPEEGGGGRLSFPSSLEDIRSLRVVPHFLLMLDHVLVDWQMWWQVANASSFLAPLVSETSIDCNVYPEVQRCLCCKTCYCYSSGDIVKAEHLDLPSVVVGLDAKVVGCQGEGQQGIDYEPD